MAEKEILYYKTDVHLVDREPPKSNKYVEYIRTHCGLLIAYLIFILMTLVITSIIVLFCIKLYESPFESVNLGDSSIVHDKLVVCYYNLPSSSGNNTLLPQDIQLGLCTHINVAFAKVVNREIYLEKWQLDSLEEVVKLKKRDPILKVLISVGGAGETNGFPEMVANHTSRKVFIKSIKSLLHNYSLDGVDLDWEFPDVHDESMSKDRERQHFSQLLREIRMEYIREKHDYLLTVAVAAPQSIVDVSYDVDQLDMYTDFVNIMTYDFHYYTKFTPFTGFNAALYPRPDERLYLATLNVDHTVRMFREKGLSAAKIVVGIPTYGHTFQLVNANNPNVGSPASGYGSLGSRGYASYKEICAFVTNYTKEITIQYDTYAKVPYLYRNQEWVSYDTPQSVAEKARFVRRRGLRGAMVYSLNSDDDEGACNRGRFPLINAIHTILHHNESAEM